MATFRLTKSMERPATADEEQEAMELIASNPKADIVDEIIPELEQRWRMPVTRFFCFRMCCNLVRI